METVIAEHNETLQVLLGNLTSIHVPPEWLQ